MDWSGWILLQNGMQGMDGSLARQKRQLEPVLRGHVTTTRMVATVESPVVITLFMSIITSTRLKLDFLSGGVSFDGSCTMPNIRYIYRKTWNRDLKTTLFKKYIALLCVVRREVLKGLLLKNAGPQSNILTY